ncbi:hypothetical protein OHA77_22235 [Streptosporangium sp. NBC_01639]|uniref:hypothetical protein n=1 Tax=Streptosporangium sp. NBC_01639 TaxID=2975948 RepID=UPI003865BADE|nr:hypothetical protein OHA77_22235 [Streptosporangium sp. NBC_01639]
MKKFFGLKELIVKKEPGVHFLLASSASVGSLRCGVLVGVEVVVEETVASEAAVAVAVAVADGVGVGASVVVGVGVGAAASFRDEADFPDVLGLRAVLDSPDGLSFGAAADFGDSEGAGNAVAGGEAVAARTMVRDPAMVNAASPFVGRFPFGRVRVVVASIRELGVNIGTVPPGARLSGRG